MSTTARHRGQPVYVLLIVLAAWLVLRIIFWQLPFEVRQATPLFAREDIEKPVASKEKARLGRKQPDRLKDSAAAEVPLPIIPPWGDRPFFVPVSPVPVPAPGTDTGSGQPADPPSPAVAPVVAAGHQILFAAGLAHLPLIDAVRQALAPGQSPPRTSEPSARGQAPASRWTLDAWLLARQGAGKSARQGLRPASYGASQTGAVLRYRLSRRSRHVPFAYARLSKALSSGGDTDVAVGVGGRPISALPIAAHAELRGTNSAGGISIKPSAFAVTQVQPFELPGGMRAEAYAQAGYVAGEFATAFADGQLKIDRELAGFDLAAIRAGVGAWGGAQKGAERVDIGPTASVQLKLGEVPARIAVDYRVRIAGDAAPGSGIAVTLTTGF